MNQTLVAENVVKKYSSHLALDQVSISVPEGCIFGLLGPNGAGKTTLIRIINQITAPDEGAVYINGEKLSGKQSATCPRNAVCTKRWLWVSRLSIFASSRE